MGLKERVGSHFSNGAILLMWSVYIIRCGDNSLYTGISNDVPKRFEVHQSGSTKAAKYTRNRHPLQLVFSQEIGDKSAASVAEYRHELLQLTSLKLWFLASLGAALPWSFVLGLVLCSLR
jgi:putative endonuclease